MGQIAGSPECDDDDRQSLDVNPLVFDAHQGHLEGSVNETLQGFVEPSCDASSRPSGKQLAAVGRFVRRSPDLFRDLAISTILEIDEVTGRYRTTPSSLRRGEIQVPISTKKMVSRIRNHLFGAEIPAYG